MKEQDYFIVHSKRMEFMVLVPILQKPSPGYANYAERALQGSMAGSPAAVQDFLTEVHEQIRPIARDEVYEMEKFKVQIIKHYGTLFR